MKVHKIIYSGYIIVDGTEVGGKVSVIVNGLTTKLFNSVSVSMEYVDTFESV